MASFMDSIKYQEIKKKKLTVPARNLIIGQSWILQQDNDLKTNIKIKTRMGHWAQNKCSVMAPVLPWHEPYRKWVGWTEEEKQPHGAGILKGLDCLKEWSLTSCLTSDVLQTHQALKVKTQSCYLVKTRLQKVLNKRVPLIVANVY